MSHFCKYKESKMMNSGLKKKRKKLKLNELTQGKETIANLKREVKFLRDIIAWAPGNLFYVDKTGKYLAGNNNVAKLVGLQSSKSLLGRTSSDFFDSEIVSNIKSWDNEVIKFGKEKYAEEVGINEHGEKAIYLSKKTPIFDRKGEIAGILGISFDITDRKKMEEELKIAKEKAEAANQAKSQFLAMVNHELRTPLASLIGLVDFLKKDTLTEFERKVIFNSVENCTHHLLSLVDEILRFSELKTNKHRLRLRAVNLKQLFKEEIYSILHPLAESKSLSLHINTDPQLPPYVLLDPRLFRQIMINLINNAIKFTQKGSVVVNIVSLKKNANSSQLAISVKDTGIGIPKEKWDIIFEPFKQIEERYVRQSSRNGMGLGLTIVKKFAFLMGAQIHVESEVNKGSTFTLKGIFEHVHRFDSLSGVRLYGGQKPRKKETLVSAVYPGQLSKEPHILLIEDDPIVMFIQNKMLKELGCKVFSAACWDAAKPLLPNKHMVFVDISLPEVDGLDVIKYIRQQYNEKVLPIVALTVYTGKKEKRSSLEAGANGFVNKPIAQSKLRSLLLKYLT